MIRYEILLRWASEGEWCLSHIGSRYGRGIRSRQRLSVCEGIRWVVGELLGSPVIWPVFLAESSRRLLKKPLYVWVVYCWKARVTSRDTHIPATVASRIKRISKQLECS